MKWHQNTLNEIERLKKNGYSIRKISEELQIPRGSVSHILTHRLRLHINPNFEWNTSLENQLKKLLKNGRTYKEIANLFDTTYATISRKANQLNLARPNVLYKKEQINLKINGKRKCRLCHKILPHTTEHFYSLKISYCKDCENKRKTAIYRNVSLEQRLNRSIRSIQSKSLKRGIPFNLTYEHLLSLYQKQQGLCFYSKNEMLLSQSKPGDRHNLLSVDRIEPSKGYVQGNVVLCTWLLNAMKLDSSLNDFVSTCCKVGRNFSCNQ